jgi:hypothetical protein
MTKHALALAEADHDCNRFQSYNGCSICSAVLLARSRYKWNRLREKWSEVEQRMARRRELSAMTVAAVMTGEEDA